jgi:SAM-dependent methyltransferase
VEALKQYQRANDLVLPDLEEIQFYLWQYPENEGKISRDLETFQACFPEIVPLLLNGPVLDLGCGKGSLTLDLRAKGVAATGIDNSRYFKELSEVFDCFEFANAENLGSFGNGTFETALCWYGALCYCNSKEQFNKMFFEALRVLKTEGALLIASTRMSTNTRQFLGIKNFVDGMQELLFEHEKCSEEIITYEKVSKKLQKHSVMLIEQLAKKGFIEYESFLNLGINQSGDTNTANGLIAIIKLKDIDI